MGTKPRNIAETVVDSSDEEDENKSKASHDREEMGADQWRARRRFFEKNKDGMDEDYTRRKDPLD